MSQIKGRRELGFVLNILWKAETELFILAHSNELYCERRNSSEWAAYTWFQFLPACLLILKSWRGLSTSFKNEPSKSLENIVHFCFYSQHLQEIKLLVRVVH